MVYRTASPTKSPMRFPFILKLVLNELWAARILFTFEGQSLTAAAVQMQLTSRIRFRIKANARPDFLKAWANKGVLCYCQNNILQLKI